MESLESTEYSPNRAETASKRVLHGYCKIIQKTEVQNCLPLPLPSESFQLTCWSKMPPKSKNIFYTSLVFCYVQLTGHWKVVTENVFPFMYIIMTQLSGVIYFMIHETLKACKSYWTTTWQFWISLHKLINVTLVSLWNHKCISLTEPTAQLLLLLTRRNGVLRQVSKGHK